MTSPALRPRICTTEGYGRGTVGCGGAFSRRSPRVGVARALKRWRSMVQIPKDTIVSMIKNRAGADQAEQAAGQLPDVIDHEEHGGLLQQFGIDPHELAADADAGAGDGGQY